MHAPVVAIVNVCESCGDAAFCHHSMRLSQQRLADEPDARTGRCGFDRCAKSGPACSDHKNVVSVPFVFGH
jgi:hypothetical protein